MISLRIKDTKVFMSQLLIKDTFDRMLLSEATIKTACSYTINGQINKEYYSDVYKRQQLLLLAMNSVIWFPVSGAWLISARS